MSKSKGYLDEIQAHCDEDMFKEMLRMMAQAVSVQFSEGMLLPASQRRAVARPHAASAQ